jgi:hypothetical protein
VLQPADRFRRVALTASLGVAALASLAVAPASLAQDPALPPIDYSQYDVLLNTLGNSSLPTGGGDGEGENGKPAKKKREKRPTATARQRAALRFEPVPEVTQRLYQDVIDQSGQDPTYVTTQLDTAKAEFRRVLVDGAGWRVDDLGDLAAFSLVQAYIKVHDDDGDLPKRGLERLRRDVRDDLALQKQVRRASDARKQEIAESLELRTIFLISGVVGAQMIGDTAAEAEAREAMRAWAKDIYGVNLAKLELTRRGLVKR